MSSGCAISATAAIFAEKSAWDQIRWTPALAELAPTFDAVCFGTLAQRNGSGETIRTFLRHTREDALRVFDLNLRAPFILSRDMAKLMIEKGVKGCIINISSGAARKMRSTAVPYCVSKTALDRLNLGLALELAEFGIRVNAVEPGFAAGSESTPLTEEHVRKVEANIPLGRSSGPEDAPSAILYLCSDAASFITGANLAVDGGNSAGVRAVYQDKKKPL